MSGESSNQYNPVPFAEPPSYSHLYPEGGPQVEQQQRPDIPFWHLQDLRTHTHPHRMLASIDVNGEEDGNGNPSKSLFLYDWTYKNSTRFEVAMKDPGESLAPVRGFMDLGDLYLPNNDDEQDVVAYLTAVESSEDMSLPTRVQQFAKQKPDHKKIHLWSFLVYSKSAKDILDGQPTPVWKWMKPNNMYYSKAGFWETELETALDRGVWTAGKELMVMVHGLPESDRDRLVGVMTTSLEYLEKNDPTISE